MSSASLLGSKISLITKSELRYEGILYTIDSKESTVALAKVRWFGTEDRPTDRPVMARDEVYEYIIFRIGDIKDLHVSEPPKSHHSLPHDPAIVQHSQPIPSCVPYSLGQPMNTLYSMPSYQPYAPQSSYSQMPIVTQGHNSGPSRSVPQSHRKSTTSDAGVQVSVGNIDYGQTSREGRDPLKPRNRDLNQSNFQNRRRLPPNRLPSGRRSVARRDRSVERFQNDYDFEQANAEFQELQANTEFQELENQLSKSSLDDTTANPVTDEKASAYNKEKSFFDDISCEATQRSKGLPRFDWRYERKLNVETFGVAANNAWLRRRRARGGYRRGFRSRGGYNRPNELPVQKTVTFDDTPIIKEVEVVTLEEKPDTLPVIEVMVEKEKTDWPEPLVKAEVWQ